MEKFRKKIGIFNQLKRNPEAKNTRKFGMEKENNNNKKKSNASDLAFDVAALLA